MSWCNEMIAMLLLLSLLYGVMFDKIVTKGFAIFIVKVIAIARLLLRLVELILVPS